MNSANQIDYSDWLNKVAAALELVYMSMTAGNNLAVRFSSPI